MMKFLPYKRLMFTVIVMSRVAMPMAMNLIRPTAGVSVENFRRVYDGMTLAEVEGVLGSLSEELRANLSEGLREWEKEEQELAMKGEHLRLRCTLRWSNDTITIYVGFVESTKGRMVASHGTLNMGQDLLEMEDHVPLWLRIRKWFDY